MLSPTVSVVVGITAKERMRGPVMTVAIGDGGNVGLTGVTVAG